jgi:hypothetical protein
MEQSQMSKSDGSTADYYELPEGARELQDLISHRNLNAQDGEMFRAIYRKGRASHSDELRDARKVLFYATAEVKRLEKLQRVDVTCSDDESPVFIEPASLIDDESPRAEILGQNGEMGEEVYAAVDKQGAFGNSILESTTNDTRHPAFMDSKCQFWSERGRRFNMNRWIVVSAPKYYYKDAQ